MYKQENDKLIRVTRKAAEKAYNEGKAIYLLPCKMRLNNMWINPYKAIKGEYRPLEEGYTTVVPRSDFDSLENCFTYYNCNNETGRYIAWYIEKPEQEKPLYQTRNEYLRTLKTGAPFIGHAHY